ncbi:ATP-binding protein [Bifidobacterium eulemuris]|uniref:ATP-dependent DNA helicase recG C-terminal n=1 Tax=Bifidobacterium eulemuris TaxID=1765219 RepID=A0A261G1B5_9BIFI|nr:ATP-binding protein [Bifidobacterium eulemuris]OZG65221.1 ATP-dependent DNA helicase recG C-terminal [Bifidobacterium eulemuris]QOL32355.1 putative DNA binding domain-containing protein [Bifidobacterium eulemuris]
MGEQELNKLIAHMRQIGNDTQTCEVKESVGGIPRTLTDTLSAFSNEGGGTVVLGISEKEGFIPAKGFDARRAQEGFVAACGKLTPVVRPLLEIVPFEGSDVLVAHIDEMPAKDKPCYVTERGRYQGSFIRSGDGDRRLTAYEVDRLLESRQQPTYDDEVVPGATIDDLDATLVNGLLVRQRTLHPRVFATRDDQSILTSLHVLRNDNGAMRPTLGGLLALGTFPQQFFPRLNITFTAFPGVTKTETVSDERRFLDARTLIGPIPVMIDDAIAAVTRNMRTGAVIGGTFRRDVPDYPQKAVREAVANALMHRDYSPDARGAQVQVNLYADRLEILNPGGLYGAVTIENIGTFGLSSSRNQFLSTILESTPDPDGGFIVENKGTGYQVITAELAAALMPPPQPRNSLTAFSLTFEKRRLSASERNPMAANNLDEAILTLLGERSSASSREITAASGMSRPTVINHINALIEQGLIEPTEPNRSPKQRYRLVRKE